MPMFAELTIKNCNILDTHSQPCQTVLKVRKGLGMQAISAKYKTGIEYDCRKADCGICLVKVAQGADAVSSPTNEEIDFLKAMMADPDERLCCQMRILGDGVELVIEKSGLEDL